MNTDNLCSVTKELVEMVAGAYPEHLMKKGEVNLYKTLFVLGFYIDQEDYLKGIRPVENILVRCLEKPDEVYKTKIYSGKVRKAVREVIDGRIYYDKRDYHALKPLYMQHEVLQPINIKDSLGEAMFKNILEIGNDFILREPTVVDKCDSVSPNKRQKDTIWEVTGYTAYEWKQRCEFEKHDTQQERDSMYISVLDEWAEG